MAELARHVTATSAEEPALLNPEYAQAMRGYETHTGLSGGGIFDAMLKTGGGYPVVDFVQLPRQFSKGFGLHVGFSRIPPSTPQRMCCGLVGWCGVWLCYVVWCGLLQAI